VFLLRKKDQETGVQQLASKFRNLLLQAKERTAHLR